MDFNKSEIIFHSSGGNVLTCALIALFTFGEGLSVDVHGHSHSPPDGQSRVGNELERFICRVEVVDRLQNVASAFAAN